MKLNEKLKVLLANQGWSQKRLAETIFVSPDAVSSWVRGINQPDLDTINVVRQIKRCTIHQIISGSVAIQ